MIVVEEQRTVESFEEGGKGNSSIADSVVTKKDRISNTTETKTVSSLAPIGYRSMHVKNGFCGLIC